MIVTEHKFLSEKCTGCMACYNVCPVNAIKMKLNKEGFYYPVVNKKVCIKCGKCAKVCAVCNDIKIKNQQLGCYSYQGSNELRAKSSSGGLFYQLAKKVLDNKGVVFGAYFNSDSGIVEHTSTDNTNLEEIMRSKYVQSKIGDSFFKVKDSLNESRQVLFVGTPCQVYALKKYLGKDFDNLITVDFVCHGVPGTGMFKDMVKSIEKEYNSKVINVTFREKDKGWRTQVMKFYFSNGKIIEFISGNYYYYYYFLNNITLRKSCYTCEFPQSHYSDMTLMDYWQIAGDDDKGVSAVSVNTEKGQIFLQHILSNDLNTISFNDIKSGFISHENIGKYKRYRKLRDKYMSYFSKNGFEMTIKNLNKKVDRRLWIMGNISKYGGKVKLLLRKLK